MRVAAAVLREMGLPAPYARSRPLRIEAQLRFRAFPPFLIRAFATYERERAARGERPSGPQMTESMLERLDIVDLAKAAAEVP